MCCQYKHFDTPYINVFQHLLESQALKLETTVIFSKFDLPRIVNGCIPICRGIVTFCGILIG